MFFLAIRHLFARKKQTLFTLMGIVLGATAYVVITGFFLGFQDFLLDQLLNNDAHIHISAKENLLSEHSLDDVFFPKGESSIDHVFWASPPAGRKDYGHISNPLDWYKRLAADERVVAYSPELITQVVLSQAKSTVSATLIGCDPLSVTRITNIGRTMQGGSFSDLSIGGNRIILGKGLLDKLGARISQTVLVSSGKGLAIPYKIVGVFKTGMTLFDDMRAFTSLNNAQRINNTPNEVNEIIMRVNDYEKAAQMADNWALLSGDKVKSWDQINANFFAVFKIQNMTRYLMISVILVVAAFGIYNVLNMTVTQKKKEIAILRSMGFDSWDIIRLFFSQGFILGMVGGLLGLFFGYWICRYLQTIHFGGGPLGGEGLLRITITPDIYLQGMALAVVSACIASLLPARSAGKMTPIEIIRSGAE